MASSGTRSVSCGPPEGTRTRANIPGVKTGWHFQTGPRLPWCFDPGSSSLSTINLAFVCEILFVRQLHFDRSRSSLSAPGLGAFEIASNGTDHSCLIRLEIDVDRIMRDYGSQQGALAAPTLNDISPRDKMTTAMPVIGDRTSVNPNWRFAASNWAMACSTSASACMASLTRTSASSLEITLGAGKFFRTLQIGVGERLCGLRLGKTRFCPVNLCLKRSLIDDEEQGPFFHLLPLDKMDRMRYVHLRADEPRRSLPR